MKKLLISCVALFVLAGTSSAFSLNIDPPSVWLKIATGESKSGIITIENRGEESIIVKAYSEDWIYGKDRSKEFKKPGAIKNSCSNWISIYPSAFTLAAKESKEIKYNITAPLQAQGGYYSVIFFESRVEDSESNKNSNVIIAGRIGTIIYLETQKGTIKNCSIEGYSVRAPEAKKPLEVSFDFANTGNTILMPKGTVVIIDDNSNLFAKFEINKLYILQNEKLPIKAVWNGKLERGEYNIITTIDFEGDMPITVQKRLKISK